MGLHILIISFMALSLSFGHSTSEEESKPEFAFSWLDDKDTFKAGEIATIKIKVLNNFDKLDKNSFKPTLSVNGKTGNSSYISGVLADFRGDSDDWKIFFTTISAGLFNVMINEDSHQVLDSSLHFQVEPGRIYPSVCVASWMGYMNEFEAGTRARLGILPKDAFGNNVTSTSEDPSLHNFTLSALHQNNGSVASLLNITSIGWNGLGYISVDFIAVKAGNFFLLVQGQNQTLSGNPLAFKVNPGPLEVSNCVAKWNYEPNAWQLFSKMELFIHQQDQYGNLVPGLYEFDAEVVEKETNLTIPVPDLYFEELVPGIQLFSFSNLEPGNFLLKISDSKHNKTISNMPYAYTVFVGYCNGSSSVVNGSGLNSSIAGAMSEFSVYLRDSYQYSSPVEPERLQVQIVREIDSHNILPRITPMQIINDTTLSERVRFEANGETEIAPSPSAVSNHSVENSSVLATAFNVVYTPDKSGSYGLHVYCGNVLLNDGHSFTKEVRPGEVNISLSEVVKFSSKVPKQVKNEVVVQLMDSFNNPVLSQETRLKLDVTSMKNTSGFSNWKFVDNHGGSYTASYVAEDIGTYQICASFDDKRLFPCPFEVNVYSSEYFPRAFDDKISVWEDESVAFDVLANDFFAGDNASILEFSQPSQGSLLQYERLLRYTPRKDYYGNDSFTYTVSDINGNIATASVNISVLTIPPQFVSFPSQLQATEDEISPKFGGFAGFALRYSDVSENISVNLSAQSGTISLSPMLMQFWPIRSKLSTYNGDGKVKSLVLQGTVEAVDFALKSIQYFGNENFFGGDTIKLSTSNTHGENNLDIPLFVDPINDAPFIHVPEFIILTSNEVESLIYDLERDKFEFSVGDPDIHGFPGGDSLFMVIFSVEVDNGFLATSLPAELINTTEIRTMNSYQWQPLQTYVTISQHFAVKANGIRFRGTINDCNSVMKQLFYYGGDHGTVLTVTVNDMGNYGCYPNCAEMESVPLYTEASVNLIRRRPMSSFISHALGSVIVIESIMVLALGVVLLSFTCKCALVLVHERRNNAVITETPEAAPAEASHKGN